ncbi:MAG: chloride channel protein [Ignavibacteria bacterium]
MNLLNIFRHKLKSIYDSTFNRNFRTKLFNALPFWIGAIITGLVAVFYAKLFALAELGTAYIFKRAGWSFFIITPAAFVLARYLVTKYSPFSRGSGIPQVVASIELSNPRHNYKVNKLLSLKVIFIKILSSIIMIFGGGAIGREGPTVQISASIFKVINDILPDWFPKISKRNMIVTGAAAGLASAFNTPLGGIVFAIEELTKTHFSFFKSALLTGVIIAGLTALNFLGPYLYLGYPQLSNISALIIIVIVPVSIITGICGSGMGRAILFALKMKNEIKFEYQKVIYVVLCGLVVASIAFFIDSRVFGSGKQIMVTTLFSDDKHVSWYVPLIRILGPVLSFSTGASGGIFAPSLCAGASIGAVISGWLHLSPTQTNLIVLCGMVGFLTGIIRSPFTSSILVIEMTNSHNVIFHLMLAALLANIVSNFISRHSFYDYLKDGYIKEIHKSEDQEPVIEKKRV